MYRLSFSLMSSQQLATVGHLWSALTKQEPSMGQSFKRHDDSQFDLIHQAQRDLEEERLDDALRHYSEAIAKQDKYALSYLGRAKVRMIREEWKAAIADLNKVQELMPRLWSAYFLKAEALEGLGEAEAAVGVLAKIPREVRNQRQHEERRALGSGNRYADDKYAPVERKFAEMMEKVSNFGKMRRGERGLYVLDAQTRTRMQRFHDRKDSMERKMLLCPQPGNPL